MIKISLYSCFLIFFLTSNLFSQTPNSEKTHLGDPIAIAHLYTPFLIEDSVDGMPENLAIKLGNLRTKLNILSTELGISLSGALLGDALKEWVSKNDLNKFEKPIDFVYQDLLQTYGPLIVDKNLVRRQRRIAVLVGSKSNFQREIETIAYSVAQDELSFVAISRNLVESGALKNEIEKLGQIPVITEEVIQKIRDFATSTPGGELVILGDPNEAQAALIGLRNANLRIFWITGHTTYASGLNHLPVTLIPLSLFRNQGLPATLGVIREDLVQTSPIDSSKRVVNVNLGSAKNALRKISQEREFKETLRRDILTCGILLKNRVRGD
ncbi:MAG: hypothetical protein AB7F43_08305 [Bacteriovoracia bacterium]